MLVDDIGGVPAVQENLVKNHELLPRAEPILHDMRRVASIISRPRIKSATRAKFSMLALVARTTEFFFYHLLLALMDRASRPPRDTTVPEDSLPRRSSQAGNPSAHGSLVNRFA
jgi:hypothetical protein